MNTDTNTKNQKTELKPAVGGCVTACCSMAGYFSTEFKKEIKRSYEVRLLRRSEVDKALELLKSAGLLYAFEKLRDAEYGSEEYYKPEGSKL